MLANCSPEGQGAALRKLRKRLVGLRARQWEGLIRVDIENLGSTRRSIHLYLHDYAPWGDGGFQYQVSQLAVA